MSVRRRIGGPLGLIALAVAAAATGAPSLHAAPLNLHGVVELTTRWSRWEHSSVGTNLPTEETRALQQRYQLGSSGSLAHPNVGNYTVSVSLIDDVSRLNDEKSQDLAVKDFYFATNLLPRHTPVALSAQRTIQDYDAINTQALGTISTNTSYNLTWDIPLERLPRLRVNLSQTELETDTVNFLSLQRTRSAALDADGQAGNTRYFTRYQLSELSGLRENKAVPSRDSDETTSYTITASTDTRFTPALTAATRVNYSSQVSTLGVVTPGLGTLQQRSAGASVFYRPSLQTSLSGMYDYYKDPFVRHLATGSASLRPLQELDLSAGYRLARFDVPDALTQSHYAFASANYRPILGLSTNLTASIGLTEVTGATEVRSVYQNYGYGANYLKTLTLVVYRLGYQGNYSENRVDSGGGTSRDITNVFTAGLSNTQTRLVALSGDYALSLVRHRTAGAESADQVDHRVQVTANSSAPQNLFLTGDFMVITAYASYAATEYRTDSNHIVLFNVSDTYETGRGVAASVGLAYEAQSQLDYDNKTTTFIQLRWLSYIVRNGTLDMTAKQSWEQFAGNQQDVIRSEAGALFSYFVGKVSFSADYRAALETRPADRHLIQTAFAKVSRPF